MKSRFLSIISLFIGIALFSYLLKQIGPLEVLTRVRALGAGFFFILAISSLRQLARSYAWLRCLSDKDRSVGLWAIMRARLAGDALADLTAAGPVIGEPIKIAQLQGRLRLTDLAASLAVENLTYAISSSLLVMAGTLTLLVVFAVADHLRTASMLALFIVASALLSLGLGLKRRWRVVSALLSYTIRYVPRAQKMLPRVLELETFVFDFYAKRRGDFLVVAVCELLFHLAGIIEIYTTLHLIGYAVPMVTAFVLEAVNRVINIVFAFVPAMMGVDEAGTGLLTSTLGLGAGAGVTLAIIRKARMFVWIALGLGFLVFDRSRKETGDTLRQR